jgi:trehalose utilization protein
MIRGSFGKKFKRLNSTPQALKWQLNFEKT